MRRFASLLALTFLVTLAVGCEETVTLTTDKESYAPGETIKPLWTNNSETESIFLAGCTTYVIERWDDESEEWINLGPPAVCFWEGYAVEVEPGQEHAAMETALTEPGLYRFHGTYSKGCQEGEPLSSAECTEGPIDVYSASFVVE